MGAKLIFIDAGTPDIYGPALGHQTASLEKGIMQVASPGHAHGHSFYALENQGQKIMSWGDIMVLE